MKQLIAFTKKEFMELNRTGRFLIMLIIFILLGIINPAIAKLTPLMYKLMADSMAEQGIVITNTTVDALTSWTQFYKNISIGLIVLVVMFCGILVTEYQKGTLINMLTKGLTRWKVIAAKSIVMILMWTLCYWLSFGITYGYNAYFWDNKIAAHLFASSGCIYLAGIWLISLIIASSAFFETSSAVLLSTGGIFVIVYLLSMIPSISKYLPTKLLSAEKMISGAASPNEFTVGIVVTLGFSIFLLGAAIWKFNIRQV